jgi:hypothetical protein
MKETPFPQEQQPLEPPDFGIEGIDSTQSAFAADAPIAEIVDPAEVRFPEELREELTDALYAANPSEPLYPEDGHFDIASGLRQLSATVHLNGPEVGLESHYNDEEIKEHFDASGANDATRKALECLSKIAAGECTETDREGISEPPFEIDIRPDDSLGATVLRDVIQAGSDDDVREMYDRVMAALEKNAAQTLGDDFESVIEPTDDPMDMRARLFEIAKTLDEGAEDW